MLICASLEPRNALESVQALRISPISRSYLPASPPYPPQISPTSRPHLPHIRFAFHLLDVSTKSKDLQNVFKAVTQNGRSIMMTALFGVIIVYIYAILGYVYLR